MLETLTGLGMIVRKVVHQPRYSQVAFAEDVMSFTTGENEDPGDDVKDVPAEEVKKQIQEQLRMTKLAPREVIVHVLETLTGFGMIVCKVVHQPG